MEVRTSTRKLQALGRYWTAAARRQVSAGQKNLIGCVQIGRISITLLSECALNKSSLQPSVTPSAWIDYLWSLCEPVGGLASPNEPAA